MTRKKQPELGRGEAERLLKSQGISATRPRVKIASILLAPGQHLSANELMKLVNQGEETVCRATIYNTMDLFTRKGLVREVFADTANVYYDSNTRHHHHFYDVMTGTLVDIPEEQIIISQLPELPDGMVIQDVDVTIRLRKRLA